MSDHLEEFKDVMEKAHVEYTKSEEPKKSMSEPRFTPGPWVPGTNPCMTTFLDWHEGKAIYPKNGYYPIAWANAENEDGEIDIQTALANATLIAAAPEMYKMLDLIRSILVAREDGGAERIEKILRKARGESEVSEWKN